MRALRMVSGAESDGIMVISAVVESMFNPLPVEPKTQKHI